MSLITRCPACGTMFKVVPDQLKVSQGWVRCGQCSTVFDASVNLNPDAWSPQVPPALRPELEVIDSLSTSTAAAEQNLNAQNPFMAMPRPGDAGRPVLAASATKNDVAESAIAPNAEVAGSVSNAESSDVSFVRHARRQAFWRKPIIRLMSALAAVLLITFLALQWAVLHRDRIEAFESRLKPVFLIVCDVLTCSTGPVRQIEAIVIDSSSFNKISDSTYRLGFSIKNSAASPVAMPSLEMTLTDTQDQTVVRRVLTPDQFGKVNGLLEANGEFSGSLTLQLTAPDVSPRIAGYRLLAFYP